MQLGEHPSRVKQRSAAGLTSAAPLASVSLSSWYQAAAQKRAATSAHALLPQRTTMQSPQPQHQQQWSVDSSNADMRQQPGAIHSAKDKGRGRHADCNNAADGAQHAPGSYIAGLLQNQSGVVMESPYFQKARYALQTMHGPQCVTDSHTTSLQGAAGNAAAHSSKSARRGRDWLPWSLYGY